MQNTRYSYWPIPDRPPLTWPDGARVALLVLPNIEHLPWSQPRPGGRPGPEPDIQSFAHHDYGNRLGVWRLADVLSKHGVRATVALNSDICRYEPQIVELGQRLNWEWMGHGVTNSQFLRGLDEQTERDLISEVKETITKATGSAPRGWLSPGRAHSEKTPDLLAEAGFIYLADWSADDQPFPMRVKTGRMICVQGSQVSDTSTLGNAHWPAHEFERMLCEQFDQLYEEGAESGRVMSINLHAYLIGYPYRIRALDAALAYIASHSGVWRATGGEVADWYYAHHYDEALKAAPFPSVD